jgi:CDP-diacylglycerol--serine O-phosphatidyltransferase
VDHGVDGATVRWLILVETMLLGMLMFSRIRYFSFKGWPKGDRVPSTWIFLAVVMITLLAIDPPTMMMLTGLVYVGSGILITLLGRRNWKMRRARRLALRRRRKRDQQKPDEGEADS